MRRMRTLIAAIVFSLGCGVITAAEPAAEPYRIRREIPAGQKVTTAYDAMKLALEDIRSLKIEDRANARYVWVPDWFEPESGFAQVSMVANSTISRTANLVQPVSLADGKLLRIDLAKYAAFDDQVTEIRRLYELLAQHDSYFNVQAKVKNGAAVIVDSAPLRKGDAIEVKTQSGVWDKAVFDRRDNGQVVIQYNNRTFTLGPELIRHNGRLLSDPVPTQTVPDTLQVFTAAPYLYPEGSELFELTGSAVPIMRLDEWVTFTFSTVNGGKYYQLTGINGNLVDVVRKFAGDDAAEKVKANVNAMRQAAAEIKQQIEEGKTPEQFSTVLARFNPQLAKTKAYIGVSGVTGRQRLVDFFTGAATAPTSGIQMVSISYDIGEDNINPDGDPGRNLVNYQTYDGGEAILALPNGLLMYVVFDKQDKVIASVPDNVAHDFKAKDVRSNVATARVFSGTSCAYCHEAAASNWGWQPVVNDKYDMAIGLGLLLGDRGLKDQAEAVQNLATQYGADNTALKAMLDMARLPYQYRTHVATGKKTSREVIFGIADSHWGYWYDLVDPQVAALELGFSLKKEDAQLFLLRAIEPEQDKNIETRLLEDGTLLDIKDGRKVTPAQWRAIFQNVAERKAVQAFSKDGGFHVPAKVDP